MFEMDPGNPMARLFYVWAAGPQSPDGCRGSVLAGFPPEVRETVPARLAFFLAHAMAGNAADAHAALTDEIEAVATATDVFPRILAQGYALLGASERALHWLAIAVDRGFINYPFLARYDPFFEKLRSHPRFQQLIETVRDRWERSQYVKRGGGGGGGEPEIAGWLRSCEKRIVLREKRIVDETTINGNREPVSARSDSQPGVALRERSAGTRRQRWRPLQSPLLWSRESSAFPPARAPGNTRAAPGTVSCNSGGNVSTTERSQSPSAAIETGTQTSTAAPCRSISDSPPVWLDSRGEVPLQDVGRPMRRQPRSRNLEPPPRAGM